MRVCARCLRHVVHKTCPFCAARRAVVAGALTAAALGGIGACGGKSTIGVPVYLDEPSDGGADALDATKAKDTAFFVDVVIPDVVGKDTSPIPIYGAPPLPPDGAPPSQPDE